MAEICRGCLSKEPNYLRPFFDINTSQLYEELTCIQVSPYDGLPPYICDDCVSNLQEFISFKNLCYSSYTKLRNGLLRLKSMPQSSSNLITMNTETISAAPPTDDPLFFSKFESTEQEQDLTVQDNLKNLADVFEGSATEYQRILPMEVKMEPELHIPADEPHTSDKFQRERMTSDMKARMLDLVYENRHSLFRAPAVGLTGLQNEIWSRISNEMNSVYAMKKTPSKCRKCFRDMRSTTIRKIHELETEHEGLDTWQLTVPEQIMVKILEFTKKSELSNSKNQQGAVGQNSFSCNEESSNCSSSEMENLSRSSVSQDERNNTLDSYVSQGQHTTKDDSNKDFLKVKTLQQSAANDTLESFNENRGRMTNEQKERLIELVYNYRHGLFGARNSTDLRLRKEIWSEITIELNGICENKKSRSRWEKSFADAKLAMRKKLNCLDGPFRDVIDQSGKKFTKHEMLMIKIIEFTGKCNVDNGDVDQILPNEDRTEANSEKDPLTVMESKVDDQTDGEHTRRIKRKLTSLNLLKRSDENRGRMNSEQKYRLLELVFEHRHELYGRTNASDVKLKNEIWSKIANELNSMCENKKSVRRWMKSFSDMKMAVRKKVKLLTARRKILGTDKKDKLNDQEELIVRIFHFANKRKNVEMLAMDHNEAADGNDDSDAEHNCAVEGGTLKINSSELEEILELSKVSLSQDDIFKFVKSTELSKKIRDLEVEVKDNKLAISLQTLGNQESNSDDVGRNSGRMSSEQKKRLLDLVYENRYKLFGIKGVTDINLRMEIWSKISTELNSMCSIKKTPSRWIKSFRDLRLATKKRIKHLAARRRMIGDECKEKLTRQEEFIVKIWQSVKRFNIAASKKRQENTELQAAAEKNVSIDESSISELSTANISELEDTLEPIRKAKATKVLRGRRPLSPNTRKLCNRKKNFGPSKPYRENLKNWKFSLESLDLTSENTRKDYSGLLQRNSIDDENSGLDITLHSTKEEDLTGENSNKSIDKAANITELDDASEPPLKVKRLEIIHPEKSTTNESNTEKMKRPRKRRSHFDFLGMSTTNNRREYNRLQRRHIRDTTDPFDISDAKFLELYRLPKLMAENLIEELSGILHQSRNQNSIPSHLRVLSALRFYATGNYQRGVGEEALLSMSQTCVSFSILEISTLINHLLVNKYVKLPKTREECDRIKEKFYDKTKISGVLGAIGTAHFAIFHPKKEIQLIYFNKKQFHSLNVLLVCDMDLNVLYINACHGGSIHKSEIWNNANIRQYMEDIYENEPTPSCLLGDIAFPLQPYLIIPVAIPSTDAEINFNAAHLIGQNTTNQCIQALKIRFGCLARDKALRYSPERAGLIVNACVVLHNILNKANVPLPENTLDDESIDTDNDSNDENTEQVNDDKNLYQNGLRVRTKIIENDFNS